MKAEESEAARLYTLRIVRLLGVYPRVCMNINTMPDRGFLAQHHQTPKTLHTVSSHSDNMQFQNAIFAAVALCALGASAETHKITFTNNCGKGTVSHPHLPSHRAPADRFLHYSLLWFRMDRSSPRARITLITVNSTLSSLTSRLVRLSLSLTHLLIRISHRTS